MCLFILVVKFFTNLAGGRVAEELVKMIYKDRREKKKLFKTPVTR